MTDFEILSGLTAEVGSLDCSKIVPMAGCPWLLASALQKAIRRGDAGKAMNAADALWHSDKQRLWRRLHIIAMEDVGVGDIDAMTKVLMITATHTWRRKVGDRLAAVFAAKLLAQTAKNRMADHLYIMAEKGSEYYEHLLAIVTAHDDQLADLVADIDKPIVERALAVWLLSGTKKYPSDCLPARSGNSEYAAEVVRGLDAPKQMVDACIAVMNRTPWPLALMMPLIWQEAQRDGAVKATECAPVIPVPDVDGVPVYAADTFTRCGQSSIKQLQKTVPFIRKFSVKQIGLGVFYSEGCQLNRAVQSTAMNDFALQAEFADVQGTGLDLPRYLALQDTLVTVMPVFNEIRVAQLEDYLKGLAT